MNALAATAVAAPDRPALWTPAGDRTFGDLDQRCHRLARAFVAAGAGDPESAVALLCSNRPEFVETVYACQRGGQRLTPVNWHLSADEIAYIVGDCEARVLIADARFAGLAQAVAQRVDVPVRLAVGGAIAGFDSFEEAVAAQPDEPYEAATPGFNMLYTSGTTGRPKGVVRRAPSSTTHMVVERGRFVGGESTALVTGPLYHAAPLALNLQAPLSVGCGVVLMDGFDAEEFLRLVERHAVTHTHMVPTMFHRLLALPEDVRGRYDVSSLRYVLHGAAPCPVHVKRAMIEWWGPIVHEYYAATEGGGTSISASEWLDKPGSVGRPIADAVVVRDGDGDDVPAGTVGTVWFARPEWGDFSYFKAPDKTAEAYDGSGRWFTLHDHGYFDDDGYLFLTGRTAEVIISGGVNVYPAEVDGVLLMHDSVGDAAVVGAPSEEWGEEVLAVVEPRPGIEPTPALADELLTFCREHLAHYKCPRRVEFVDRLPRSAAGKVLRAAVRGRYWHHSG